MLDLTLCLSLLSYKKIFKTFVFIFFIFLGASRNPKDSCDPMFRNLIHMYIKSFYFSNKIELVFVV